MTWERDVVGGAQRCVPLSDWLIKAVRKPQCVYFIPPLSGGQERRRWGDAVEDETLLYLHEEKLFLLS